MGKGHAETFHQRRYMDGKKMEKMFNIFSLQRYINQDHDDISPSE